MRTSIRRPVIVAAPSRGGGNSGTSSTPQASQPSREPAAEAGRTTGLGGLGGGMPSVAEFMGRGETSTKQPEADTSDAADEPDFMADSFLAGARKADDEAARKRKLGHGKGFGRRSPSPPPPPVSVAKKMTMALEEGMATPLDESNKGYKLLAAMGYVEGAGIGRRPGGIAEPVGISIKADRAGIGGDGKVIVEAPEQVKKRRVEAAQATAAAVSGFRSVVAARGADREVQAHLRTACSTLRTLDERAGVGAEADELPPADWYPLLSSADEAEFVQSRHADDAEVVDEADRRWMSMTVAERLEHALHRLRTQYFYCLFCGELYDDAEDLEDNCPGEYEDQH